MIIAKPPDCSGAMWGARPRHCSTELHHSPERSPRSESAGIHAPLEEAVIHRAASKTDPVHALGHIAADGERCVSHRLRDGLYQIVDPLQVARNIPREIG
jgi:hypothetical protein